MYTKFRNVTVNQNSTSCATAIGLITLASSAKPIGFAKLDSASGRRLYTKGCFLLSLGNNAAAGSLARCERANVITLADHVLIKVSNGLVKSNTVAVKQTTLTANAITKASGACKRLINKHKHSLVRFESAIVYNIGASAQHLNKQITHLRFKAAQSPRTTLILGEKHKTTPYWSKVLTSVAFIKTLLLLTERAVNTKRNVFATLNACVRWLVNTKSVIALSRGRVCCVMRQHKLTKLMAFNALNAFISARVCKANRVMALLQITTLIAAHKFLIKSVVLKTTLKSERETMYRNANACLN
ncbi:hypothetical protein TETLON1_000061 [Candidatus Hodgkinia cicadicola]|nr:hypothetical protein TETLON1_000061 [Candidatus Hodgkinia cicadicola]